MKINDVPEMFLMTVFGVIVIFGLIALYTVGSNFYSNTEAAIDPNYVIARELTNIRQILEKSCKK